MTPVSLRRKVLQPHKSQNGARFEMRNVLTNEPFDYVDLWLRRNHEDAALFFWRQAKAFFQSAANLPTEAKPLLLYYTFMNAAKALLTSKHIAFSPYHGVRGHNMRPPGGKVVLSNEGVRVLNNGVLAALSSYFGEAEHSQTHSLEEILYNVIHVHRTYCLTYPRRRDLFLPLKSAHFMLDEATGEVVFEGVVGSDVDWQSYQRCVPNGYVVFSRGGNRVIHSSASVPLSRAADPSETDLDQLRILNEAVRKRVKYIRGSQTLWYLKMKSPTEVERDNTTLTLAAMHRLSELSRYHPDKLMSLLNGQRNWLLNEFIAMSPGQFLDEIASEMTGHQILVPNVRTPK